MNSYNTTLNLSGQAATIIIVVQALLCNYRDLITAIETADENAKRVVAKDKEGTTELLASLEGINTQLRQHNGVLNQFADGHTTTVNFPAIRDDSLARRDRVTRLLRTVLDENDVSLMVNFGLSLERIHTLEQLAYHMLDQAATRQQGAPVTTLAAAVAEGMALAEAKTSSLAQVSSRFTLVPQAPPNSSLPTDPIVRKAWWAKTNYDLVWRTFQSMHDRGQLTYDDIAAMKLSLENTEQSLLSGHETAATDLDQVRERMSHVEAMAVIYRDSRVGLSENRVSSSSSSSSEQVGASRT